MAENKTKPTRKSIDRFINSVEPARRADDARLLLPLFKRATGMDPVLWGDNMIGFGTYHYRYKSGRQGDYFLTGFSPRKAALSVYIMPGFKAYQTFLSNLGRHKHSVSCLYLTNLSNIDLNVLHDLVRQSVEDMKRIYPDWSENAFR